MADYWDGDARVITANPMATFTSLGMTTTGSVIVSGRWPTDEQLAFVADGLRTTGTGDCLCLELVDGRRIPFRSIFVDSVGWLDFHTDDTVEGYEFIRTRIQSGQLKPDSAAE